MKSAVLSALVLLSVLLLGTLNVFEAYVIKQQRALINDMVTNPACLHPPAPKPAPAPTQPDTKYDPNDEPVERRNNVI